MNAFDVMKICGFGSSETLSVNVRYVAVGYGFVTPWLTNSIVHSANGIEWFLSSGNGTTIFSSQGGRGVCWNGSIFVAVGIYGISFSRDGINWTCSQSGTSLFGECRSVCWNGSIFVAVGYGTVKIAYSSDGITWTASDNGNSVFIVGNGVCWNGSIFVAVGYGDISGETIAYSSDGITWTSCSDTHFYHIRSVCWNGSIFVAVGSMDNSGIIVHSSDGITWTVCVDSFFYYSAMAVCWNGSIFVAVGSDTSNSIAYSANGIDWSPSANGREFFSHSGECVCWDGNMFLAGGQVTGAVQKPMASSIDGINWTEIPMTLLIPFGICSVNAPNLYPPTNSDGMLYVSTSYNITFSTGAGTWNDDTADDISLSVSEGYIPVCPSAIKAPTGYYVTGWSPSLAVATENKTYIAQFAENLPLNAVYFDLAGGTWTGGGAVSQSVADNGYATEPTMNPPVSNHPDHRNFTFIGWDTALGPITSNTTITALWQMNDF